MLLNRSPRFGCDQAETDSLAARLVAHYSAQVSKYRTLSGARFFPLVFGTSPLMVYNFGPRTAALPNGRLAHEPLAMSVCPSPLRPALGPTAELRSVASLPYHLTPGGVSYIIELSSASLPRHNAERTVADLLRAFFNMGGMSIAFNILDEHQLREAQLHPDRYRWLTVRVFGYSHRFVELSEELQEYIIQRCQR
jgi:formate C-acetyltransferase